MENNKTDLFVYNNDWYKPGNALKRTLWHFTNCIFFKSGYFPFFTLKVFLLRLFGASIGRNVLIKPYVNIKYPWHLQIKNDVWIGEEVWIDNLAEVIIKDDVCISQGAYLLTGNHDFTQPGFDLLLGKIVLEEGVWLGARSVVCPNVTCGSHSILSVASVASHNLEPYFIYKGNPAIKFKERIFK